MIDWNIVGKMWGGFGVNILVLAILSIIAWIVGLVIQKTRKTATKKDE
ncbi:MAG: hypothetical protein PHQ86_01710 [Dehalococcoidales bacterium]|nr:hypothetical protein [Dehalococcoidales bacterium]